MDFNTQGPSNCYTTVSKFATSLFKKESHFSNENIVLSPTGALLTLSMFLSGASGESLEELLHVMGFANEAELSQYAVFLKDEIHDLTEMQVLNIKTKIYTNASLRSIFSEKVMELYNGKVRKVTGFGDAKENLRKKVNAWLARHTQQILCNVIKENSLDNTPQIVGACANFFQCGWKKKFTTGPGNFKSFMQQETVVQMIKSEDEFKMCRFKALKSTVIEIPYDFDGISMWFVLPDPQVQLDYVEDELTGEMIDSMIFQSKLQRVAVDIPKFRIRCGVDLRHALEGVGIKTVFDENRANLSRMSYNESLVVSGIVHESLMEVNELGTWANPPVADHVPLSVTNLPTDVNENGSASVESFYCDRPFLFFVRHEKLQHILFIGRVMKLHSSST